MNFFITGGSRGIGRSIVLKLVREGHNCAFTYNSNEDAARETIAMAHDIEKKSEVECYQMDVRQSSDVDRVADDAIERFGTISGLVNNAAIVRNNAAALMSDDEWDDVIAANLSGVFYSIRSFLMHFIGNRFGRIINISSLAQDGASGQINYAASKAGLVGMTKALAREYGAKGITCNIVAVGFVETDMTRDHLAQKLADIWMEYCPMKRVGTPEEIASIVHYLTIQEAGFINGEIIRVSGGLTYIP